MNSTGLETFILNFAKKKGGGGEATYSNQQSPQLNNNR
jgi:hypothetical protein